MINIPMSLLFMNDLAQANSETMYPPIKKSPAAIPMMVSIRKIA